ncbi:hypothetical protein [Hymenobacter swuensis]|uniref:Uncharacterized protein n=1 Tax=Hymenobacter swuensis DY53 TaxID=1227739 RepID=W8F4M3_9BACT|nr:hypothetical protein [Hymenobacter swuensis]AHJ98952.1 hypothetical protein Hsw_3357 [Hymenobacter swuensis DY53]
MITLLYSLFAILCGVIEAVLYARRGAEAFQRNEHIDMTLQRIAAALLAPAGAVLYIWQHSLWLVVAELVPAALVFPLFHDEAYNYTRLWLTHAERYVSMATIPGSLCPDRAAWRAAWIQYRYGYQSPTTTARNDFNGTQRTWLAVVGVLLLLVLYLIL